MVAWKRLSVLLFFAIRSPADAPKSVDAVLADYVKALGGSAAIDAIHSRKIKAKIGLLGEAELYWQAPSKVLLLAKKERTGFDGGSGWVYTKRKKTRRLQKGQETPLEIDGNPLRYANLHQLYTDIRPAAAKTVDGEAMDVLIAPNDLAQTAFYFDKQTHLLVRIEEKGETSAYFTQTIWFDDYKPTDGVLFPYSITQKSSDKNGYSEDFRVKKIENNVEIDPEFFSKPQASKLVLGGKR